MAHFVKGETVWKTMEISSYSGYKTVHSMVSIHPQTLIAVARMGWHVPQPLPAS